MKWRRDLINFSALIFCFGILGCSGVGSDYIKTSVPVPTHWNGQTHSLAIDNANGWWRDFHDPILNQLIEQQALRNLDLKTAKMRVEVAQAQFRLATAQLFPIASFQGLPPNGTGTTLTQVLALTAALEIDLWGRLRQTRVQVKSGLEVTEALERQALLNLRAEIALSYLELREAQVKISTLKRLIAESRTIYALLKSRYKAGLMKYLDLAQQSGLIDQQLSDFNKLQVLQKAMLRKLEVLTGHFPGRLEKLLSPQRPIPEVTTPIRLGVPSEILRRRPDIIAAEREIAAAHAGIRIALASLFPKISIGWLLGWQTETLASNLFAIKNPDSTLFGLFDAPILNMGLYKNLDVKKQEKVLAIVKYQAVIMHALHEVETQYDACVYYHKSIQHLKHATEQKRLVLKLSRDAYQKGLVDFNTVFLAEEDLSRLELSYLHDRIDYEKARIYLYKALGD